MGILDKALKIIQSPRGSSDWDRTKKETKWDFVKKSTRGVKLRKKYAEEYQNMETGKTATYYRKDTRVEWHHHEDYENWPEYVEVAMEEGECWESDVNLDGLPTLWGHILGGGTWRRER